MKQIQNWWRIIRFPYFSRRQIFRLLTRKIEAAMDAYKDETVLRQGSKIKQTAPKGSKGKGKKQQKKKSSRPDTRENVREHVDRLVETCIPSIYCSTEPLMTFVAVEYRIVLLCIFSWLERLDHHQCL